MGLVFDTPYFVSRRCVMKRSGIGKRADVFRLFLRLGEVLLELHVLGFVGKLPEILDERADVLHECSFSRVIKLHYISEANEKQMTSK